MKFFDYFQIIALALFYLIFLGRLLQLRIAGTNALVLGVGKSGLEKAVEVCFMVGLMMWSFEVLMHSLGLRFHFFPDVFYMSLFDFMPARVSATVLISAGFVVFILSLISFGQSWRVGIDTQNPGSLVTSGIFSRTRNPIFVFLDLYFLGTWLIYPNLFFGIFGICTIAGIHWQILKEENFLKRQYGTDYMDYMQRVRRYV
jgi:protein-S-isoprenylcysteine O-methyltransferase Ste14